MTFNLTLMECPTCRSGNFQIQSDRLVCIQCTATFAIRDRIACFLQQFNDYTANYEQICTDDLVTPKTPSIVKQIFTQLVQERARGITCDLGCGDGYVIQRVESPEKIAVDIAFDYLKRLPESMMRIWGEVETVPLASGCIETIICTDVLEHVQDATLLAREIDRLLQPEGKVLLAFPFEQDLSVYDLPEYKAKYAKYKYVHLRSVDDVLITELFPEFEVRFSHLIVEGMKFMEFKPYPIKFVELVRRNR